MYSNWQYILRETTLAPERNAWCRSTLSPALNLRVATEPAVIVYLVRAVLAVATAPVIPSGIPMATRPVANVDLGSSVAHFQKEMGVRPGWD